MTPFAKWKPIPTRQTLPQWARIRSRQLNISWESLAQVNRDINAGWKYQREERDHWQSPSEMMSSGAGDCEDFAILKRAIIGSGEIIIGRDALLGSNHAVLFVDGVVLDCTHDRLLDPAAMPHFTPVIGMDAFRSWMFGEESK